MKILYLANDRRAAELSTPALRLISSDVAAAWASDREEARRWIAWNRDVAALIIDVESDAPAWTSFVSQIRALGVAAPLVVVSAREPALRLAALEAVADAVVVKDASFPALLPDAVRGALHGSRKTAPKPIAAAPARGRLRMLYVGDATLAKECLGRSLDVVEAAPERGATLKALPLDVLAGAQPAFDVILIEHAHPGVESRELLRDISARRLQVPVVIVAEWDEALAVSMLELGAVDIVANSRASLRAVLFRIHRLIAHSTLLKEYSALRSTSPREPASSEDHRKDAELAAARLAEAAEARQQIERRLAQREIEFRHAEQRATVELQTALRDFTRREAELEAAVAREAAQRGAVHTKLDEAETALAAAMQRAASGEREREHTIERQLQIEADLARESAARTALQQQLANAKIALQRAEARSASAAAAADERLADAQARFDARLSEAAATQAELDGRLTAAESARRQAEEQAAGISNSLERKFLDLAALLERAEQQLATERRAAATHAAEREAAFDLEIATALANRQQVEKALEAANAALAKARDVSSSQLEAAAARQTDLAAQVAQAVANRQALEHAVEAAAARLAEHQTQADAQMAQAVAGAASAIEAAEERAARERRLAAEQAAAAIDTLEQRLAVMAASLEQAAQDAAAERRAASEQASAREARFERDLAGEVANRLSLEKALEDVKAARAHADREHAAQIAAAEARLSEHTSQFEARIAQVSASAAAALEAAEQRAASERQAAAGQAAERQSRFDADLAKEVASRQSVEKALEDARAARMEADREHAAQIAAAEAGLSEHTSQFEARIAQASASAAAALEAAEQRAATALESAKQSAASERQAAAEQAAERQSRFEADLAKEVASRQSVEKALEDARAARMEADREHAAQIAAAAAQLAEHQTRAEAQLAQAAASAAAALEAATRTAAEEATARQAAFDTALEKAQDQTRRLEGALTEERTRHGALQHSFDQARAAATGVQHRLDAALGDISRDRETIDQLHGKVDTLSKELDETRRERDALRAEAVQVPQLRTQIDDVLAGRRREFDHAAVSLCRWQRDGGITRVNHAAVGLLGYDTPEELQQVDFDRDVFESSDELQWLVDRCLTSGATESIETTWMKKDGARIIVRVLAVSTNRETVDLAAQDITTLRVLEEKLRHSQRMESVARYGSEVAVTCDNLLRHVEQEGQDWLSQIDSPTARYHGQLLLDEVTRAAAFLRQLAVYGDEQKNAAELVDVNEVLVDLEPVLSRVAGPNIDFVLPKSSRPLNLDVDAERVERILVNVAAYGRERMPSGGRLVIEVAPVILDRAFVAKYPNVRPGAHVLLTVNELRSKAGSQGSRESLTGDGNGAPPAPPGVDLGALQALVSDCGGHLWMKADPPGDMVLKIHLPRRVLDRPEPRTPVKQPAFARWLSRVAGVQH